jgi:glycosyltransferase involved in cell wall biosynthesis
MVAPATPDGAVGLAYRRRTKFMIVYADLRWPDKSGIGTVKQEMLQRMPGSMCLVDLKISSRIGTPYSPVAISKALKTVRAGRGVFWSPGFIPPSRFNMPCVVTVHDLIHLQFYTRIHAAYYNWVLLPLYRRCSKVIVVSEHTRQQFLNWSGITPENVVTVYSGVSDSFLNAKPDPMFDFRYVLYPGNHRNYKNTPRLVQAFARSGLPQAGIHLVFTGQYQPKLLTHVANELVNLIHFVGDISSSDLVRLYKSAHVVAFVSLSEGFGLPILEAMASGVPVLTSNLSAMPEVAGGAALLVDPYSVDEISNGLNALSFDLPLRSTKIGLGLERTASNFTNSP